MKGWFKEIDMSQVFKLLNIMISSLTKEHTWVSEQIGLLQSNTRQLTHNEIRNSD